MSIRFKIIITAFMIVGFAAGFCNTLFPRITVYDLERIHIFFFNLCCGGTIILYYTQAKNRIDYKTAGFFILSAMFAIAAFFNFYIISIIIVFILAFITESVRIKKFSFFSFQFFKSNISIAEKFHNASLLCLSIGLVLSVFAIINQEYYQFIYSDKAGLNTFFLGFSFPLSLITFSLIFSFIKKTESGLIAFLKNISFWAVNSGVIIFFIFILFNIKTAQFFISAILLAAVINIFILFYKFAEASQQKTLLISGLLFLIVTAITGILYIKTDMFPEYYDNIKLIIKMHAVGALYGWNLTGLAVILRFNDFPINTNFKIRYFQNKKFCLFTRRSINEENKQKKKSGRGLKIIISLHWITMLIFTLLGHSFLFFAVLATVLFFVFLIIIFFTPAIIKDEQLRRVNRDERY